MDNDGNLYVSDWQRNEVRRWKIEETFGIIVAGGNDERVHLDQLYISIYLFIIEDHLGYASDSKNH
jgi:hypothetical protein